MSEQPDPEFFFPPEPIQIGEPLTFQEIAQAITDNEEDPNEV